MLHLLNMVTRKKIIFWIAFAALAGIINCAVIEPAFAQQDHTVGCQAGGDEDHCCFVCYAQHHQWMPAGDSNAFMNLLRQSHFSLDWKAPVSEPPLRSIFRPPVLA